MVSEHRTLPFSRKTHSLPADEVGPFSSVLHPARTLKHYQGDWSSQWHDGGLKDPALGPTHDFFNNGMVASQI